MDTFLPIDFQKSIIKERLVYKTTTGFVFRYVFSAFNSLIILGIVTLPAFVKFPITFLMSQYYIIFIIAFYAFAIANLFLLNSLVKVTGIDKNVNRKDIIEALSKYFKLENLDETKPDIIRDVRLSGTYKNGRVITCLLNENTVYLNVVRLVRPDAIYFYSALYMHYKCKRTVNQFKKLQTYSAASI